MTLILVYKLPYGNYGAFGIDIPIPIAATDPERGDITVFRYPSDPSIAYLKRVIGLPGDEIKLKGNELRLNGEVVERKPLGEFRYKRNDDRIAEFQRFRETLGSVSYDIVLTGRSSTLNYKAVVPDNHFFVLGDNRDESNDSRYWGFVPKENIIGRLSFVWFRPNKPDN